MIGFRVHARATSASPEMITAFRDLPVANVSDVMHRMTAAGSRLRPFHDGSPLAGAAVTVRTRPGDNLMIHKAIDISGPNDVIVVDGGGDMTNALIGELMVAHATQRGIAGFVLHGAIRDVDCIGRQSMPVFAAGVTHRGPYKDGPGEINVPIAIAGMTIDPGDLVIGDADGVVAVPHSGLDDVLEAAKRKSDAERKQMEKTLNGTLDRSWVDRVLEERGCAFEDA
ncbi:RraA family protein [Pseudoponticoccus marisrubri]|uniref:Putative 4-hydroxy-4-methyl-2-oxoglutarate aldolase n=1 Tax=Pseudoponticoccus marisrubri TaxID=1685382 RepID=A0A0W7WEK9_9RHOB|nr:RraA family protein [Pseudoponticoccus marisrubri]KUF08959.1 methyltransferase [Pseudoponticoccus marisrubri]